jgi:hypothetical protein
MPRAVLVHEGEPRPHGAAGVVVVQELAVAARRYGQWPRRIPGVSLMEKGDRSRYAGNGKGFRGG